MRQLRSQNVGNLRDRLRIIKDLKREEYEKKYASDIGKEIEQYEGFAEKLNLDWNSIIIKINKIIDDRKKFETKSNSDKFELTS